MIVLGFIGLSALFFLHVLAKGAARFKIGPQWLQRLIIDKRSTF